jgi:hypothetical protein
MFEFSLLSYAEGLVTMLDIILTSAVITAQIEWLGVDEVGSIQRNSKNLNFIALYQPPTL